MNVIIIGPYPPPYGGISVHIKRIKYYLQSKKVDVSVYNESGTNKDTRNNIYGIKSYKRFIFKIPFLKADIMHFHSINIWVRILLGFYKLLGKKIILTIHGESSYEQLTNSKKFVRYILLNSLKRINKIICVNPKTISELVCYGINKNKIACIPAYINPIEDENESNKISKEVWHFIDNSKFLISANGWITFNRNEDLYGLDILIELISNLKIKFMDIKLLIALLGVDGQNEQEREYYNELKGRITQMGLEKYVYIYEVKDTEFYPILKKSHLFLRPTNTDGYGVSIAEAICYKVPSIASDVCKRPEGTILFRNRNMEDLYNKTIDVIENYEFYKDKLKNIKIEDNAEKILEVYKEIVGQ